MILVVFKIDKRKLLTKKTYSKISDLYTQDFGGDYEHFEFIDELIEELKRRKLEDRKIIDLGSGPGNIIDYLYKKGLRNLIAVDITSAFCKLLKKKYKKDKKVKIICSDMVNYVKKRELSSVAAYTANYSIIHIPDEEVDDLFRYIRRTLLPNGLFVMSCHKGTYKGMEEDPYQRNKDPRLKTKEKLVSYMNYFTEDELKYRIKKSGLNILKIKTYKDKYILGDPSGDKIRIVAQNVK